GGEADWAGLARSRNTLVVYMGVGNAGTMAAGLMAGGLSAATPVAVIENGTLPQQRVLGASLGDLAALIVAEDVRAPALLVIGDVAARAATAARAAPARPSDLSRAG
ncbi:MAG: uroporphyrinogen-III C-methyltransferase, partial [Proteobacteria bacterium]|nr:uroporphyrinogen-III C-methyltransferase [Pseudomonadota bacterium]